MTGKLTKLQAETEAEQATLTQSKNSEVAGLQQQMHSLQEQLKSHENVIEDNKSYISQLTTDRDELKFEKEKLEKQVKKVEGERDVVHKEKEMVLADKQRMEEEKLQTMSSMGSTEQRVKQLMDDLERIQQEKRQLAEERSQEAGAKEKLSLEKDVLFKEKADVMVSLQQQQDKEAELLQQIEAMGLELNNYKDQLMETQKASHMEANSLAHLRQKLEASDKMGSELEHRLQSAESEKQAQLKELDRFKQVQQEKQQLESQHAVLRNEIDELKRRESKVVDDFEVEKTSLQNTLDTSNLLLQQKDSELEKAKNELTVMQGELVLLKSHKSQVSSVEAENRQLEERVQQLEFSLAEMEINANVNDYVSGGQGESVLSKLQEEKLMAEGQIEFLNSVIVDMQHKNEELKRKVDIMAAGEVVNGNADLSYDERGSSRRRPAPRLFCDICDMFDLHDTDDCPTQAMSDSPPPSLHHGDRKSTRPYCQICEVFGHWTNECDDEQTF